MAQDFSLQGVLATEERSGHYARGSMCALKGKRQARDAQHSLLPASPYHGANQSTEDAVMGLAGVFLLSVVFPMVSPIVPRLQAG